MSRALLLPLVPLYAGAVAIKNSAYDHGWAKSKRLRLPVVSAGNISAGGSGKTPFVISLAKLLKRRGVHVDVLSRGYGRRSTAVEPVDAAGNAERYGDEPLLIANATQAAVYLGADRYEAGLLAEKEWAGAGVHLLDDGFQHRKLARDLDIVLLHRSDFHERLLPAGRMRELVSSLNRASVLVLRDEDTELETMLKTQGIQKPIWWIQRSIAVPTECSKAVAFCGIAHPKEFFDSLRRLGVALADTRAFPDHYAYREADIRELARTAGNENAGCFLTTEKDFVRLSQEQKQILDAAAPVKAVKLNVTFRDEDVVLRDLQAFVPSIFQHTV